MPKARSAVSNTFSPEANAVPNWLLALAVNEWSTPLLNSLANVKDPLADTTNHGVEGFPGIINDYTGIATDNENKAVAFMAQGGHEGYYGNEFILCSLNSNNPVWTRRRDATAAEVDSADHATWSDGRPVSSHGYCIPLAAEGRFFLPGLGSVNFLGGTQETWFEFSTATNDWTNRGNFGNATVTGGMASAWDAQNRRIIFVRNNFVNPAVKAVSIDTFTVVDSYGDGSVINDGNRFNCAIDSVNHILCVFANGIYAMDLNNIAGGFSHFTPSGSAPNQYNRSVYDPNTQAFYCWNGTGKNIHKFTPTLGSGSYSTGAWSSVTGTGVTPPDAGGAGHFGKTGLLTFGSRSVLVIVPAYQNPDLHTCRLA